MREEYASELAVDESGVGPPRRRLGGRLLLRPTFSARVVRLPARTTLFASQLFPTRVCRLRCVCLKLHAALCCSSPLVQLIPLAVSVLPLQGASAPAPSAPALSSEAALADSLEDAQQSAACEPSCTAAILQRPPLRARHARSPARAGLEQPSRGPPTPRSFSGGQDLFYPLKLSFAWRCSLATNASLHWSAPLWAGLERLGLLCRALACLPVRRD